MLYRRISIPSQPAGGFIYALAFEGANYIQIGVGYESVNGLQLTHVRTEDLHHSWAVEFFDTNAEAGKTALPTGKLAPYFDGSPTVSLDEATFLRLRSEVAAIRNEQWGHPLDWEPVYVELKDGRFIWVAYGHDIDKLRVGIGFHDEAGDRNIGDHAYALGPAAAKEFACLWFSDPCTPLLFVGRPPRWPAHLAPWVQGEHKRQLAVAVVLLGDMVWKDLNQPQMQSAIHRK